MRAYTQEQIQNLNKDIQEHYPHLVQITPDMKVTHDSVSRMVMLDRYAQKDQLLETLKIGDLVVARIKDDAMFPTLGIAYVVSIDGDRVTIQVEEDYIGQIDPSFNAEEGIITLDKKQMHKPLEIFYEQIAIRVGNALGKEESEEWRHKFAKELSDKNIIPAGRVLYGAGSGYNVTYFNCFVMPMIHDSREGISKHRSEVMEIMSRGGGVGTNGSTLRPKDASAISVGGKSSGAVSWLNDLSTLTDLVQQGGSRRGAQMIMLQSWHPDIIEFIVSKMQKPEILKWIMDNFEDSDIKRLAKDKLKFRSISAFEKEVLKSSLISLEDEPTIKRARAILKEGGTYEVKSAQFLSGANISVGVTNDFMEAIKANGDYELKFPDIDKFTKEDKAYYEENWQQMGDVREWEKQGRPTKVYKTIKARELWDLINFCATYSAEPGVFFIDRANEMTNAAAYGQKVVCTNPCGEQPLAPYSVCNLAAINLANMVNKDNGEILWDKLATSVESSVRMQDNIINATPYFLKANEEQALGERRVGMGVMGLHDLLIWKGIRYGSEESMEVIDKIFEHIARVAYIASAKLAKEKGAFPFMKDVDSLLNTGYIKKLPEDVKQAIRDNGGLRNSHLLTIAPTGSTGTMAGVSTGLEPYFAFKYYRSGRLGKFMEVDQAVVAEWRAKKQFTEPELPDYFISAMELAPEEHADVQAVIQRWIDSSISKTVNAPKGYTVKQVEAVYMRLFDKGAKGGTVYVDGSRDSQVLSIDKDDVSSVSEVPVDEKTTSKQEDIKERLANVPGNKFQKNFGCEVGDICPICKEGTVEELGGCNSCTNCGAQLKCGL